MSKLAAESESRRGLGMRPGVIHVSLNPPPELWDRFGTAPGDPDDSEALRSFGKMRARAYRVARKAGLDGGCVVFHRIRCADKDDPVATDGPHFHVLGFGWIRPDARAKSGWVVVNHGLRGDRRSIVGTAEYVLSHSYRAEGISPEGKSRGVTLTVTWFGRQVPASKIESEGPYCPLCDRCYPLSRWLELEWLGQGPPPSEPVSVDWSSWRAWALDRTGTFRADRVSVTRPPRARPTREACAREEWGAFVNE